MSRHQYALSLENQSVDGELSICHDPDDKSHIQAMLLIPKEGGLRHAFNNYLQDTSEEAHMLLKWCENEDGTFFGYTAKVVILHRQFSSEHFAIFKSVGNIEQKRFEL